VKAICEICGSKDYQVLLEGKDLLYEQNVQAKVLQCNKCGLLYLWPQPTDPLDNYPKEYAPYIARRNSDDIAYSIGHSYGLMQKANLVSQHQTGTLLDIGCANGQFLAVLSNYNSSLPAWGMDLSETVVQNAHRKFGIDGWTGTASRLPLPEKTVNIVTMWHVLEHLSSPLAALQDIARVLEPYGTLILACPMADSWEAQMFGRYWAGYDIPRHLFFFSRDTLLQLLHQTGFEASEITGIVWGYNSARISSALWLREISYFHARPYLLRKVSTLMGIGSTLMSEALSRILGNHRSIAVFVGHKTPPRFS
jgi:ubiquinone/menaquinone biosynthesis C-methylase UbiE